MAVSLPRRYAESAYSASSGSLWGQVSHLNVFEISLIFKDALLLREGKSELMKFDRFLIVNHFS